MRIRWDRSTSTNSSRILGIDVSDQMTFFIRGQKLQAELTGIYKQKGLQTRFWFEAILSDGLLDPFISR